MRDIPVRQSLKLIDARGTRARATGTVEDDGRRVKEAGVREDTRSEELNEARQHTSK